MIRKDIEDLNNIINQLHVIDISRTFQQTAKYTFFSDEHEIFAKIDHIMVYKTGLNKFKRIKIMQSMSSAMELIQKSVTEGNVEKLPNIWKQNNILLSKPCVKKKSMETQKVFLIEYENTE